MYQSWRAHGGKKPNPMTPAGAADDALLKWPKTPLAFGRALVYIRPHKLFEKLDPSKRSV
jgi:hypothetical protein